MGKKGKSHILALPKAIRFEIYKLACPLVGSYVDFSYDYEDELESSGERTFVRASNFDNMDLRRREDHFMNLTLVCRTFYLEMGSIAYSCNHFVFRYQFVTDMELIKSLRPPSLSHLRNLTLRLWFAKDDEDTSHCVKTIDNHALVREPSYRPPLSELETAQKIVDEWKSTAAFLDMHLTALRLSLNLIFDCDKKIFNTVIEFCNITAKLRLRECQIRLCHKFDKDFSLLAERTALQATGHPKRQYDESQSFDFTRLPREVQIRVLERTDLVSPLRQLEYIDDREHQKMRLLPPHTTSCRHPSRIIRGVNHNDCKATCCQISLAEGCYCRIDHSAYSRSCNCWRFPTSLFLVSRMFNALSKEIFFTRNKFVLDHGQADGKYVAGRTNPNEIRLRPTLFFGKVLRMSAAQFLRRIDIPIPHMYPTFLDRKGQWYLHWLETFEDLARSWVGAPNLTLIFYSESWISLFENVTEDVDERLEYFATTFHHESSEISSVRRLKTGKIVWIEAHLNIAAVLAEAFSALRSTCLKNFFLFFAYPHLHTADPSLLPKDQLHMLRLVERHETLIEQQVMGKNYNAVANGKYDIRTALWAEDGRYLYDYQRALEEYDRRQALQPP